MEWKEDMGPQKFDTRSELLGRVIKCADLVFQFSVSAGLNPFKDLSQSRLTSISQTMLSF